MAIEALEHHRLWSRILPGMGAVPKQAAAQRLPPLHGRSSPARSRDPCGRSRRHGGPARPPGGGSAPPRHREGVPGRSHRGRDGPGGRHGAADGVRRPTTSTTLVDMVRLHLLLPDVATRRDLGDDATLMGVADEVGDDATLRLLHALTVADSEATGPAAWGSWKAQLVEELVDRTAAVLGGYAPDEVATSGRFPTEEDRRLMEGDELRLVAEGDTITIANPDRPGAFARVAGVISLNGLNVMSVEAYSDDVAAGAVQVEGGQPAGHADRLGRDRGRPAARARRSAGHRGAAGGPDAHLRISRGAVGRRRAPRGPLRQRGVRPGPRSSRSWPRIRSVCSTGSPTPWQTWTSTCAAPRYRRWVTR